MVVSRSLRGGGQEICYKRSFSYCGMQEVARG
jgi:hypothetical protein